MFKLLWPMMLGSFALGLDAYVLAGLLPHIAKDLNITTAGAGIGVALFTAAYAISAPSLAFMTNKLAVKTSLLLGLSIFTLGNLLTAITNTYWIFLISRLISGIGAGFYSPLATSSATTLVPKNKHGRALSMVLAGLSLGTAFGVPFGLQIESLLNWRWTMIVIVILGVISFIGIIYHKSYFPKIQPTTWKVRLNALASPYIVKTLTVTLFAGIGSLGLYTYITEILIYRDINDKISIFIWLWGLGGLIGALFIGKIIDQYLTTRNATLLLLITLIFSYFLIGYAPIYLVGVSCLLWGMAGWSCMAPQQYDLINHNPKQSNISIA